MIENARGQMKLTELCNGNISLGPALLKHCSYDHKTFTMESGDHFSEVKSIRKLSEGTVCELRLIK